MLFLSIPKWLPVALRMRSFQWLTRSRYLAQSCTATLSQLSTLQSH